MFKQMTAYDMRISDWSSDVCSSDLLPQRCLECPADDVDAAALIVIHGVETVQCLRRIEQGRPATGHDTLLDGRAGRMEGIIDAVLTLLDLDFTCTADLDDRDAAGELGKTLLELLLVIVAGRVLDLRPDRVDPALNAIRGASAIDEGCSVLVDRDALGGTQHLQQI